jgi:hypothetical protein
LLRDVPATILGKSEGCVSLLGTLPKSILAFAQVRANQESEKPQMALQQNPHEENVRKAQHWQSMLEELERWQKAAAILEGAVLAVVECGDIVHKVGSAKTITHIVEQCEMAWLEAQKAWSDPLDKETDEAPYCDKCKARLTFASEIAGYCIKCTHETTRTINGKMPNV